MRVGGWREGVLFNNLIKYDEFKDKLCHVMLIDCTHTIYDILISNYHVDWKWDIKIIEFEIVYIFVSMVLYEGSYFRDRA